MLKRAVPGTVYIPFIGGGDIASELYRDRLVYGADIDQKRVDVAQAKLPSRVVFYRWVQARNF